MQASGGVETGRILLVDDEERIRRLVRMYLERSGYEVDEAEDGNVALQMALENHYALIVLDLMLPEIDGREICAKVRQHKDTPIIMLTAMGDEKNRIQGFELGADDYVVKPFSPPELVMRVKALLKRSQAGHHDPSGLSVQLLTFPSLTINLEARRVIAGEEEVSLTPKEYELLCYLAGRPEKVFSREELLRDVWNYQFYGDQRTVDTHVKRLREKLGKASEEAASMIVTVWGVGYKFEVPA
jgi:two-component system, OmpR family, response regulator ResD